MHMQWAIFLCILTHMYSTCMYTHKHIHTVLIHTYTHSEGKKWKDKHQIVVMVISER